MQKTKEEFDGEIVNIIWGIGDIIGEESNKKLNDYERFQLAKDLQKLIFKYKLNFVLIKSYEHWNDPDLIIYPNK